MHRYPAGANVFKVTNKDTRTAFFCYIVGVKQLFNNTIVFIYDLENVIVNYIWLALVMISTSATFPLFFQKLRILRIVLH